MVEAEHTIKYSAPVPVTVEEPVEDEEPEEITFEDDETESRRRRRKTSKDERDELRRELDKYGTVAASRLKLSIDKYRHSDAEDSGTLAEKDFCTKYAVTKEHILADDYLDVARKYGPGRYWFVLRMDNKVVRQWERKVHEAITPGAVNGSDTVFPVNGDASQPIGQLSWQEVIKMQDSLVERRLKEMKMFRDAFGEPEHAAQTVATDPKIAALQMIAENPDVMAQIGKGIASTVLGKSAGDGDPWADVAMEAVKSGQAAQIVKTAIDSIFSGVNALFPRGQNGQAPMATPQAPPVQNPGSRLQGPLPGPGQRPPDNQVGQVPTTDNQGQAAPAVTMNEADALVISLIQACERKAPAADAVNIINVACYRTPELGESVDALINMSPESLLAMLSAYHPDVAKWEHAKEWLKQLTDALTAGEEVEA
jgi:hypothetical protein